MEELILIKLGGSVITDKGKPFTSNNNVIRRLGREIASAGQKYKGKIIIGHGSGSFGHTVATKYKTNEGKTDEKSIKGAVKTARAAADLNRIVVSSLIKVGLNVVSFAPSSFIISTEKSRWSAFLYPIEEVLQMNIVPIVYGDVVFDAKKGFTIYSTEQIFGVLLKKLHKKYKFNRIIQCGVTDGVYNNDGKTIPLITKKTLKSYDESIGKSKSTDVTGGMLHKVQQSVVLEKKHRIDTIIINGKIPGQLQKAILGENVKGTRIG